MSNWGKGIANNNIGWGQGSLNNNISWGNVHSNSYSGDTFLNPATVLTLNGKVLNINNKVLKYGT